MEGSQSKFRDLARAGSIPAWQTPELPSDRTVPRIDLLQDPRPGTTSGCPGPNSLQLTPAKSPQRETTRMCPSAAELSGRIPGASNITGRATQKAPFGRVQSFDLIRCLKPGSGHLRKTNQTGGDQLEETSWLICSGIQGLGDPLLYRLEDATLLRWGTASTWSPTMGQTTINFWLATRWLPMKNGILRDALHSRAIAEGRLLLPRRLRGLEP